jgi:dTDP-4-dehydrorhamnose reductase
MRILILGSTGILGGTLNYFLKKKKNIKIFCMSRNKKSKSDIYLDDFTNFTKLKKLILNINPTHIINCIGITKFNNSYKSKKLTSLINAKLPITLSRFCLIKKIFFIHISTDCVFLGNKGYYTEKSKKDAQDLYGTSKAMSEVRNKYCTTIRTSFIGPEQQSKKSLMSWFLSQTNEVNGFKNAFFSGITSLELSKIIFKYFLKDKGLYNRILNVGSQKTSKYDLLKILAKVFNRNILIKGFTDFKIDRTLNNQKFKKITKYKNKSWYIMIKELKKFMMDNKYKY